MPMLEAVRCSSPSRMASTTLGSLSRVSRARAHPQRRSFHGSRPTNMILMPAISPLMTQGTVTRWRLKEGESFSAGDVLLQIESGFTSFDVCAELPGVLGKILSPDGSTCVPVEQVIALVARDRDEFARNQFVPTPSR
ncbi:hypothetical protein PM082_020357 [Marasmius tenuissimus]|nr:hypothetical protein PM082_020357 [Marasmius tenuissimus]